VEGKQARVLISVSEGRMEFEGSEEFVEKQLAAFADLIKRSLQHAPVSKKHSAVKLEHAETPVQEETTATGLDGYQHLFAKSGSGKVQILKNLPGTSTAQKMVNAARLLALANSLIGRTVRLSKKSGRYVRRMVHSMPPTLRPGSKNRSQTSSSTGRENRKRSHSPCLVVRQPKSLPMSSTSDASGNPEDRLSR
jgi:hypothetical protein